MQQEITTKLYAYWNGIRNGRIAPQRFEVDPTQISGLLRETFIAECSALKSFRFRLAGMAVRAPFSPRVGECVISYIEQLGGLDGTVARTFEGGFAVEFKISARKRERIANVLTWYSSGEYSFEDRMHERYAPRIADQKLILPTGKVHPCRVIDISLSGASIETRLRPDIDSLVILARHRGRVVRHHDEGFGIEFVELQDPDSLARTFG